MNVHEFDLHLVAPSFEAEANSGQSNVSLI
jgi:hypothetical protein